MQIKVKFVLPRNMMQRAWPMLRLSSFFTIVMVCPSSCSSRPR